MGCQIVGGVTFDNGLILGIFHGCQFLPGVVATALRFRGQLLWAAAFDLVAKRGEWKRVRAGAQVVDQERGPRLASKRKPFARSCQSGFPFEGEKSLRVNGLISYGCLQDGSANMCSSSPSRGL